MKRMTCPNCQKTGHFSYKFEHRRDYVFALVRCESCLNTADLAIKSDSLEWKYGDGLEVFATDAIDEIVAVSKNRSTLKEATEAVCLAGYKIGQRYKTPERISGSEAFGDIYLTLTDLKVADLNSGQRETLLSALSFTIGLGASGNGTAEEAFNHYIESRREMPEAFRPHLLNLEYVKPEELNRFKPKYTNEDDKPFPRMNLDEIEVVDDVLF